MMPPDGSLGQSPPGSLSNQDDARAFYENAPCGFLTLQRDGTILGANRTLFEWAGQGIETSPADLSLRDILTPASWIVFSMQCVSTLAMHGHIAGIALDMVRADRSVMPVLASFEAANDKMGERPGLIRGILIDATERRLYERELLTARKVAEAARIDSERVGTQLSAMLESTTDGFLLVESDWGISYANPGARKLKHGPLVGQDVRQVFGCAQGGAFLAIFDSAMRGDLGEGTEGLVGRSSWFWVRAYPVPRGGMVVFFRNTTQERRIADERRRNAERIEHMASHDDLTDLPNRRLFATRLREALAFADGSVALMSLDLDRFKRVNDRLGHPAGDALLKAVANRLRAELRREDMVARFGGDEFAVLLAPAFGQDKLHLAQYAERVAARIIAILSAPFAINGDRTEIGVSVGITISATQQADPDTMLVEADLALYEAKRSGRGRYAFFRSPMMAEYRNRLELGDDLLKGLQAGEMLLHYQPIVQVAGRKVCGHEALVRWNRPKHGLVSPVTFIPIAEETGLIVQLGAFVLDRACRDAAAWSNARQRVSVNVSPIQFRDHDLVETVTTALCRSGLDPARLELEITEGVLLEQTQEVLTTMHRLRALGVGFAMDDFGTGFSSLSTLRSFPFNRVKVDRSFLREAETRDEDVAIIEAVATLCRRLEMTCLAEGVETEAQFALLARAGYNEAQGYLFGCTSPQAESLC